MVKKREIKQEVVEMQDSSDSSSEEERRPMQEYSDSSSDEEQEQQQQHVVEASDSSSEEEQQQPMEVEVDDSSSDEEQQEQHIEEASDSSSEGEEQQPMEVEESDSSSDEEQQVEEANDSSSDEEQEQPMEVEQSGSSSEEEQTMDVDESEAESDQEVKSEQEEQESEDEEEVKEEAMEENEDVNESETEEEETENKSEAEEEHEEDQVQSSSSESEEQQAASSSDSEAEEEGEEQEEASSSESEEEQPKAETKKRKSVKVQMPMEVAEPKKKKAKTTHEPEQNEDAGVKGSLRAALRSLPREMLQNMLVIAAKQHADVLARLKAAAGSDLAHRKVFVGGLSLTTSSKDLREALSAFGEVKDAFVLKDKFTGMSRCFGFVTFVEVEAAQRAMEKNTFDIDGKMVECKSTVADESEYKRHTNADDLTHRKVFVGGLSSTTSSKDLREALSAFGEVKDAFVLKDKFTGKSRCFGFVTFVEVEAAQRAAEKNTFDIDGKMVECRSSIVNETDQDPQTSVDEWKRKGAVQSDVDLAQRKVIVGRLSSTTSAKGVKKALSAFGKVEGATIHLDKLTGKSRRFGFVTFIEVESAQHAVKKETFEIDGKMVECKSTVADESEQKSHTNADDLTQRKVFVGGLSLTTSSKDLREALSAFGKVKDAFVLKDKFTGKSRCFGFVIFVEVEAAQRAVEKHTFDIDGKMVECKSTIVNETDQDPQTSVDEWKRKGAVQSDVDLAQRKVIVGRLSSTTSAKGVKKALSAFGKVESATIHLDKLTGKSRRFGFVTFIEVESAQHAVEKDTFEIDGKMVECRFDHELDKNPPTKDDPNKRNLRVRFDTGLENPQVSLRSMFQEFGTVERISVLRDQETGKVKGVAFVMFKRKTGVERAVEKPTKMMPNGTIVSCNASNPDQKSRTDPDEEELKVRWRLNSGLENPETPLYNLFKEFGDVKTIFAHRDHDGKGRTGFVTFVEKTGSENALKDPVQKLDDGRVVKCKPAVQSLVTPEERRVIVQFGLGLKNPQEVLRNRFSKYGVVEKVDVQRDDDDATEKGRCVAFVTFQESAAAQRSLREPVETIGRETIKCFPSDELEAAQRTIEELQIIVLFDIGMENPKETLGKLFMGRGKVEKVDVQRDGDDATGKIRGIAFVTFRDMAAVQRALKAQKLKTENNLQCFRNNKRGMEAALRAVEKSAQEVDSNKWPEELNNPATPEEEERTIFVRFQCNPIKAMPDVEKKLLRKFSRVGTVKKIVVPCDRVTGTVRGAASIKFATCAGAQKALETPQIKMAGKSILCFPSKKLAQEDWSAAS